MASVCRIELLGGLRVQIGERSLTRFSTQKSASLLAYLAYFRHQTHPREVLIEMLWPDCDPAAGRSRLSNALWALRRLLEPPGTPAGSVLQTMHFAVGLRAEAVSTDVAEFLAAFRQASHAADPTERTQRLRQAVSLYQGELLPGFYEDWALTEQCRLADLHKQAQAFLAAHASPTESWETSAPALGDEAALTERSASLPLTFTHFFGREEEMARLQELLSPLSALASRSRLVTITGPGGTGKTRLSVETARCLQKTYAASVWFVSLVSLRDPRLIGSSLVEALALPHVGNLEPLEQAINFLQQRAREGRDSLLILDNFEQLVEGGAVVVQTLLERVPALTLLVTSRRLLHLTAEREFVLRPLSTPASAEPPERLSLYESVRLFIDRAQNARSDFQVTNKNAPAVAELCQKLEGIPLAIELAAARAQVLTPSQMLSLMQRRFDFLVSKKRDVIERHQTLRAAIEWSYRLLSPELQRFFTKLSVFRGGWTLEAAEAVCEEPQALDYLEQLREWSLVLAEETELGMRFRMLETLQEYGSEQLPASQMTAIKSLHSHYFQAFAATAATTLLAGSDQAHCLDRCYLEHDNMRVSLDWCITEEQNVARAANYAERLQNFWGISGQWSEGKRWIVRILQMPEAAARTRVRAQLLRIAGTVWFGEASDEARLILHEAVAIAHEVHASDILVGTLDWLGILEERRGEWQYALEMQEEGLLLARQQGKKANEALFLRVAARCCMALGELDQAQNLLEQSLKLWESDNNQRGISMIYYERTRLAILRGDMEKAGQEADYQLLLARQLKDKYHLAVGLRNSARIAYVQHAYEKAEQQCRESLTFCLDIGSKWESSSVLRLLGYIAFVQNQHDRATRYLSVSERVQTSIGEKLLQGEQEEFDTVRASLLQQTGDVAFSAAWEAGRALTWEEAVAYALEET